MFAGLITELKEQAAELVRTIRTREFWIYACVTVVLAVVAFAAVYLAAGFNPLTRNQLRMAISCRTGEAQIGTIIVGLFVFGLASVFTLGEVTQWIEAQRQSRAPGRRPPRLSFWRPLLHVLGTALLGIGGFLLMSAWCA